MAQDLFRLIDKEFRDLRIPIQNVQFHSERMSPSWDYYTANARDNYGIRHIVEFIVETEDTEVVDCLKRFANNVTMQEVPFMDFDDMHRGRFASDTFEMPLQFKRRISYVITISFPLEDSIVYNFLKDLRDGTQPLRQKIFEQQFDEEVEEHLTDEYNKGEDGY